MTESESEKSAVTEEAAEEETALEGEVLDLPAGMVELTGVSGAWNYTVGPAFIWRDKDSVVELNSQPLPVVVVADYIPAEQIALIDMTRVRGFVIDRGGLGDPSYVMYSINHRATVMKVERAMELAEPGQPVVVDGVNAKAIFRPDETTLARYEELRKLGPPPEPPGFAERIQELTLDFGKLDPGALKEHLFDFQGLASAFDTIMKMYEGEKLSPQDIAKVRKVVGDTPVEENVDQNLERYAEALAEKDAAGGGGDSRQERGRAGRSRRQKDDAEETGEAEEEGGD